MSDDALPPEHHWKFLTPRFIAFSVVGILVLALLYASSIFFYFQDLTERDAQHGAAVPIRLNFKDSLRGLDAFGALDSHSTDGSVIVNLTIMRSRTTFGFALFIMFATALVTAVVILVVSLMILQHRKFEFGTLGWIAGLMFALPAVRNVMPGVPGVGALSDYIVLFWALGFLVAAMIWVAVAWIRNPVKP